MVRLSMEGGYMAQRRIGNLQRAIVLGAGVGLLASQVLHMDIGLALVVGALVGATGAILRAWGRTGGRAPSGD